MLFEVKYVALRFNVLEVIERLYGFMKRQAVLCKCLSRVGTGE